MGVKSTTRLTREHAENMFIELRQKQQERFFRAEAVVLTDRELEDMLEEMNDARYRADGWNSGGFDNYLICENPDEDDRW